MRPIHLIAGAAVAAAAIVLFAGAGPHVGKTAPANAAGVQDNQPVCGDAQCVPSIIGEDQFEGIRQRNANPNRRYLFPRLHPQKTVNEGENK